MEQIRAHLNHPALWPLTEREMELRREKKSQLARDGLLVTLLHQWLFTTEPSRHHYTGQERSTENRGTASPRLQTRMNRGYLRGYLRHLSW